MKSKFWFGLFAAALGLLAGCATPHRQVHTPVPGAGLKEYQQLTGNSALAVQAALRHLEQVSAHNQGCPPRVLAAFAEEVHQLQVNSIRVRSRTQAIQARGDAYLEAWAGGANPPGEPQFRIPPECMPQIQDSFGKIKLASRQAGDAFRPFFQGLRQLRAELETNPSILQTDDGKELVRTTRQQGEQVLQSLRVLQNHLNALRPLLQQIRPATTL